MQINPPLSAEDEAFFRSIVVPEEDRRLFTSAPWRGEFRWFRAPNVVPLEKYRRPPVGDGNRKSAAK